MSRQFRTTKPKEFAQTPINVFPTMNQQRDLPPQVEPRHVYEEKLTGFQLRFDGRTRNTAQSGAGHDCSLDGPNSPLTQREHGGAGIGPQSLLRKQRECRIPSSRNTQQEVH